MKLEKTRWVIKILSYNLLEEFHQVLRLDFRDFIATAKKNIPDYFNFARW